ncbi:MAG: chloride channel protein [Polyangiaceae bacterium]|nr:chloride channel protein [Polyangiaceae bacterium]
MRAGRGPASQRGGPLPVAPSLTPTLEGMGAERGAGKPLSARAVVIAFLAAVLGIVLALVAQTLTSLIGLITNFAFHGKLAAGEASPLGHQLGFAVVLVPVVGGLAVGLMARYASKAIRGHGIPEAMEQVLLNESRIPVRMTFLKPLSAAISIGTGGPFGAEGPIIATGGALGSFLGQLVKMTADERKTLLAAGAAAGMAATFGSPVSAVLLAVELLLFEYRARSIVPVALAASAATAARIALVGSAPVFPLPEVTLPTGFAVGAYIAVGGLLGFASVGVTRLVYAVEDAFEKLPIHWMWWPALGGIAVGVIGYFVPKTLGVGYVNIEDTLTGHLAGGALFILAGAKFVSWAISLGSGTSGGTLAPLLTVGGAVGALTTSVVSQWFPGHGIDPRIGALVGMAAMFAGASRALLASVLFAFECTRQPMGLLPLLGGCAASYLVSCLLMKNTIMTEKLARRGVRATSEYQADFLDGLLVCDHATTDVVTLDGGESIASARVTLTSDTNAEKHQGFPVVVKGELLGVVTRREVFRLVTDDGAPLASLVRRRPVAVYPDSSLRDAADAMAAASVGRIVVVDRSAPKKLLGILTRSDLLLAHQRRIVASSKRVQVRKPTRPWERTA